MIQVSKPQLDESELTNIQEVLREGWLGHGKYVCEFEKKLSTYLDVNNVVAVSSGTAALHLALEACEIKKGDEVIVPSLTFVASIQAIIATGATPIFCEVLPSNLNMYISDVEKRITERTRAIMPVHFCGIPCDMDGLMELGNRYNLRIIEDAAHAFGSQYNVKKIGAAGDITCFSFDPIKNLTCGEGGAVCTNDDEIANVIRLKRMLGIDRDSWKRYENVKSWQYHVLTNGYRYHMSNINAAIGLAQFEKLTAFIRRRREIVSRYNRAFEGLENLELLDWNLEDTCPFIYIIKILNGKRDNFLDYMENQNIRCGVNYMPNHRHAIFGTNFHLPVTDELYGQIVSLPLHAGLEDIEIEKIIKITGDFFQV